jgi:Protein of unknown function (DUF2716)
MRLLKDCNFFRLTKNFPGIYEPRPSVTYRWNYDSLLNTRDDFQNNALASFKSLVSPDGKIYALDWQHTCYWFYPHFSKDERWWIDLPDGDYAIFISEDFSFGYFGHPWEATICIFGQPLLEAFQKNPPQLFSKILRRDGKPI